jgi:putative ABC transport system permease protein
MFKLNLKIALRNIWKDKLTTSIKLIGLIIGLSTVVLLLAYVLFELSYDKQNLNANQLFRINSFNVRNQKETLSLPSGLAKMLQDELPEVKQVTQLRTNEVQLKIGENFYKQELLTTENSFFSMFTMPLLIGDAKTVLKEPNTIVISNKFAQTAFPKGDFLGKSIVLRNYPNPFKVIGVMADIPKASHFHADLVVKSNYKDKLDWRGYSGVPQYLQIKEGTTATAIEKKFKSLYKKYDFPEDVVLKLMPITKIHLYSHTTEELEANSDIKYVYIFSIVAFFILLIAIVNFINLTVAASLKRGKEIGVKKVLGASIGQLRLQFLSESYLYFLFATFLVLLFTHDLIPIIGSKLGIELSLSAMLNAKTALFAFGVIIVAGFVAGLYPAVILSKLMPVKILKGYIGHTKSGFGFKKILMVFQFSVSAFLIIATLIIYAQLHFIRNKNLGFDKDQVLVSSFNMFGKNFKSFKEELMQQRDIKTISLSSFNPGKSFGSSSSWTNDNDTTTFEFDFVHGDFDFIKTLNIHVSRGRAFSIDQPSDVLDYNKAAENIPYPESKKITDKVPIMLNEAAVSYLKLKNPIDTILSYGGLQGKVIGVVSNFNGMSLHNKVKPLAFQLEHQTQFGYLYIKANSKDMASTKATVERAWKKYFPDISPDIQFMDEHLQALYIAEMRMGSTFVSFAGIAVFLCCIGLFGMVYFDLQQRTKEIAIRKILGASLKDLLALLNNGFVKVVIISNIIVWPVAYYLFRQWLNGFYYRIELPYAPFFVAMLMCLLLTVLTVSLQAIKSLRKSPVDALKYE